MRIGIVLALGLTLPLGIALARQQNTPPSTTTGASSATSTNSQMVSVQPDQIKWGPPPSGLPAGSQGALLSGDPSQNGPFTVRMRAPDGYKIKPHYHSGDEALTVLKGTFYLGMGDTFDPKTAKEYTAGSFTMMPAGMHHFAFTKGETIVQLNATGPWNIVYINPQDDPRFKRSSR